MLSDETKSKIIDEAVKLYCDIDKYGLTLARRKGYLEGATTEANKALPLLEALEKIRTGCLESMSRLDISVIAKQAITNYKNQ